ncbi:MAG: hypothetical protein WC356_07805 [Candidatus Micrarchaeia archaeon]
MIKIRITKIKDKYFIEISKETADYLGGNIKSTKTDEGLIITKEKNKLTLNEFELLRKLNSFKFEKRTPENVYKTLNSNEKEVLEELIKKGYVKIYKEGKYTKTGVYSISQKIYSELTGKQPEKKPSLKNEFMIIDNQEEAQNISKQLKEEIKKGEIKGIRGFDGKFYIASSEFYNKNKDLILKILEENKNGLKISEIALKTKLEENACLVVLRLLAEDGEIIEKGKNVFKII